jgi:hypothetical protein
MTVWLTKFHRTELCADIWKLLLDKQAVLFRSPPFSGKTSLAHLFGRWAIRNLPTARVVDYSLLYCGLDGRTDLAVSAERFERHWKDRAYDARTGVDIGISFEELSKSASATNPVVLIIDEAQATYSLGDGFTLWKVIKAVMSPAEREYLYVLVFAAYGEPNASPKSAPPGSYVTLPRLITPIKFSACLSINDIRLHKKECKWVFERFPLADGGEFLSPIPPGALNLGVPLQQLIRIADVQNWIINASGKHPGLFMFFVDSLFKHFRQASDKVSATEMLALLMAPALVTDLLNVRIFPINYVPDEASQHLLAQLLHEPLDVHVLNGNQAVLIDALVQRGCILHLDDDHVGLASPAVKAILLARWLRPVADPAAFIALREPDSGFADFLKRSIARIDSNRLGQSLSTSAWKNSLLESMWQHVYYMAACLILPQRFSLSSDVGRKFKSTGRIDFYVNSTLGWGIELTRESLNLDAHLARFQPGGIYHGMVTSKHIKHWIVLNFCAQLPSTLLPNVLYAVYSDAFTKFALHQVGQPVEDVFAASSSAEGVMASNESITSAKASTAAVAVPHRRHHLL